VIGVHTTHVSEHCPLEFSQMDAAATALVKREVVSKILLDSRWTAYPPKVNPDVLDAQDAVVVDIHVPEIGGDDLARLSLADKPIMVTIRGPKPPA